MLELVSALKQVGANEQTRKRLGMVLHVLVAVLEDPQQEQRSA